jgi:hypothetical protein
LIPISTWHADTLLLETVVVESVEVVGKSVAEVNIEVLRVPNEGNAVEAVVEVGIIV